MPAGYEENPRMPLDKVIFVIACIYLGWVVAWLISQKNAPISQNSTTSQEDKKFIAYLQSSLAIIDRQSQTSSPDPNPAATCPSYTLKYRHFCTTITSCSPRESTSSIGYSYQ